jgi:parvulin-like peptidyl-prolyl isomerase
VGGRHVFGLLLLAGIAGCNERALDKAGRGEAGPPLPAGLRPEQAAQVLARVGERTITLGDYAATLERMDQFDRLRYQSPERRKELLDEIIDAELLAQDARRKNLDQKPETQQAIRQILREAMLAEARKGVPAPADIPEEEVRSYYDAHRDEFREPERRRVAHIVVKDKETGARLLSTARNASGAEWGELYRKHSLDAKKGADEPIELAGDLGLVGPPGDSRGANARVPAPVRAAVFEIDAVGRVLDRLVPSEEGFHLVRMVGRSAAHERSLAEADRAIRVALLQAKIESREKALEDELRKQFPVTIDEQALSKVEVGGAAASGGDGGGSPKAPSSRVP